MNYIQFYFHPQTPQLVEQYQKHGNFHPGDSGLDLFFPETVVFQPGESKIVDLEVKVAGYLVPSFGSDDETATSYYIYPRSSISKTPLRLSNSLGMVDAGYRGTLKAALDHIKPWYDEPYVVKAGTRLVQLCGPSLQKIKMDVVEELDETSRGEGGFGSTGL